jgi:hypothetical protein
VRGAPFSFSPSKNQRSARSVTTSEAPPEQAADDDGSDGDLEGEPERRRHAHIPGERLLRLPQVLDMIGLSKSMVYKMMKLESFRNRGKYTTLPFGSSQKCKAGFWKS